MAPPNCCSPLHTHWPLPEPLPGAVLVSCGFTPAHLQPGDFATHGIAPPPSIQRSVAKRQAEFLAGRLCARQAVQAVAGVPWVAPIGEDRAPVWPPGISASITHGGGWAACVAAPAKQWLGLGLDVEQLLPAERARRLAGEILTPAELARLPTDDATAALAITLTFSLKESLFKALYPQVLQRFYFEHAELLEWSAQGQAHLRLLADLGAGWPAGAVLRGQFQVAGGRLLSLVAVPAPA
ncbi:4'-phosphopantetheinyl transferase family protein [Pseudomonas typographi]|uniref:4'-phosphopantetheinyl transferase family protein n=1 Tax=Pseudomonas typographi TaxID=2715964 RepID=UPI0016870E61|nr:4'-phosphopantetheinyl transferase [Pseudomonas typographi]MBD1587354.1 4'-phosphopantetheinyl transferase superfamily protein [Pseudomonas typographi]